jgi:8-oxo-dGTP pyrophosphatase MutT (NUDIX family)
MNEPVPIKPAATVMLIRDDPAGLEVFLLRRTTAAAFASGMYVFPGGKLDASDGDGDGAFRLAAIREAFEEAGVLLALDDEGQHPGPDHPVFTHRHEVHAGTVDFAELCDRHALRPHTDALHFVAHWITPKGEAARRFDTRFFVAAAPADQLLSHDDHETVDSVWIRPAEALSRARDGEWLMMPPTTANLTFLAGHENVASTLLAAAAVGTPPVILPKIRFAADGSIAGVAMPDDDDYPDLP